MADATAYTLDSGHGGPDAHSHAHPPHLAHHFDTSAQQFDAGKLGMWLFLATEVLFFAGLFCAYAIYRRTHPQIFIVGQHFLDPVMGGINTVVLICSSFTMALGVYFAQRSNRNGLVVCLALTLLGGFTFMGVKYIEYSHKIHDQIIWGRNFNPTRHDDAHDAHAVDASHAAATGVGAAPAPSAAHAPSGAAPGSNSAAAAAPTAAAAPAVAPVIESTTLAKPGAAPTGLAPVDPHAIGHAADGHTRIDPYDAAQKMRDLHIFIGIYFCMTGLHGIHVLAGIAVLSWLLYGAIKGRYNSEYYTPVDLGGLYWHLVDLVWIYLFPLLYLVH